MSEQANKKSIGIQRVYVKDLSFEAPDSLLTFTQQWKPDMHLDMNTKVAKLEDTVYEVVLTLTVTVKNEDAVAFLAEVHQAGVFVLAGSEGDELKRMLGSYCPEILFPYARECVSNLVSRAGFAQLSLSPVDFNTLYDQALSQQVAAAEAAEQKH